jgi:hypothetical protein
MEADAHGVQPGTRLLPAKSGEKASEKLSWCANRWRIEMFREALKSGCKVELAKLGTAERERSERNRTTTL